MLSRLKKLDSTTNPFKASDQENVPPPSTPPRKIAAGEEGAQNGGVFKMPLPKVKTPGSTKKGEHPSSDDAFITSSTLKPIRSEISLSPKLPHIPSEYNSMKLCLVILSFAICSSSEDELAPKNLPTKDIRPVWTLTPEVSKSLLQQRGIRPEDIFGEVEPVKLEGIEQTSKQTNRLFFMH